MAKYKCEVCSKIAPCILEYHGSYPLGPTAFPCPLGNSEFHWVKMHGNIEAENKNLEAEIEDLKGAVNLLTDMLGNVADSGLKAEIDALRKDRTREIRELWRAIKDINRVFARRDPSQINTDLETLERKVEELEKQLFHVTYGLEKKRVGKEPRPQAPDAEGKMHDVIPRRTIIKTPGWPQKLVLATTKEHNYSCGIEPEEGSHWGIQPSGHWIENSKCTWLFNLHVPEPGE